MKKITAWAGLVLGSFILTGTPVLYAEPEFTEIVDTAEEDYSDPSSVTATLDSSPGERAPEALPMDDAPGLEGIAVN